MKSDIDIKIQQDKKMNMRYNKKWYWPRQSNRYRFKSISNYILLNFEKIENTQNNRDEDNDKDEAKDKNEDEDVHRYKSEKKEKIDRVKTDIIMYIY